MYNIGETLTGQSKIVRGTVFTLGFFGLIFISLYLAIPVATGLDGFAGISPGFFIPSPGFFVSYAISMIGLVFIGSMALERLILRPNWLKGHYWKGILLFCLLILYVVGFFAFIFHHN